MLKNGKKQCTALVCAALLFATMLFAPQAAAQEEMAKNPQIAATTVANPNYGYYFVGDANGDRGVTLLDVLEIQNYIAKHIICSQTALLAANVNEDAFVNLEDTLILQKYMASYAVVYPIGDLRMVENTPTEAPTVPPTAPPTDTPTVPPTVPPTDTPAEEASVPEQDGPTDSQIPTTDAPTDSTQPPTAPEAPTSSQTDPAKPTVPTGIPTDATEPLPLPTEDPQAPLTLYLKDSVGWLTEDNAVLWAYNTKTQENVRFAQTADPTCLSAQVLNSWKSIVFYRTKGSVTALDITSTQDIYNVWKPLSERDKENGFWVTGLQSGQWIEYTPQETRSRTVYFDNTATKWTEVYICGWSYGLNGFVQMTPCGGSLYSYTFADGIEEGVQAFFFTDSAGWGGQITVNLAVQKGKELYTKLSYNGTKWSGIWTSRT